MCVQQEVGTHMCRSGARQADCCCTSLAPARLLNSPVSGQPAARAYNMYLECGERVCYRYATTTDVPPPCAHNLPMQPVKAQVASPMGAKASPRSPALCEGRRCTQLAVGCLAGPKACAWGWRTEQRASCAAEEVSTVWSHKLATAAPAHQGTAAPPAQGSNMTARERGQAPCALSRAGCALSSCLQRRRRARRAWRPRQAAAQRPRPATRRERSGLLNRDGGGGCKEAVRIPARCSSATRQRRETKRTRAVRGSQAAALTACATPAPLPPAPPAPPGATVTLRRAPPLAPVSQPLTLAANLREQRLSAAEAGSGFMLTAGPGGGGERAPARRLRVAA